MKKIKDGSLEKILKYKKYEELFDFTSLECRMAILSSVVMMLLIAVESYINGSNEVAEEGAELLHDIAIELIGFIGFTVSALAILTGVVSSRVVSYLKKRSKINILERIFLSFYFLGLISAICILVVLILYVFSNASVSATIITNVIIAGVLAYLFVFQIFYAVKLIGNCLDMFYLINEMDELVKCGDEHTTIEIYNKYRIISLEKCVLCNLNSGLLEEYKNNILKLIYSDGDIDDENRKLLLEMYKIHFGMPENTE